MGKCLKCGNSSNNEVIYGIIEKYHYDDRTYDTDIDFGRTTYSAIGIVKVNYCDECLKKAKKETIKDALKIIGIDLILLIVFAAMREVAGDFGAIVAFLAFIGIIYGIYKVIKSFSFKNKIIHLIDGKVAEENVLYSKKSGDLDVSVIEGSLSNRHDYSYKYVDVTKLMQPIKEKASKNSYNGALNELKAWYQQNGESIKKDVKTKEKKEAVDAKIESKAVTETKKENELLAKLKLSANDVKEKIKDIKLPKLSKKVGFIALGIVLIIAIVIGAISIFGSKTININDYLIINTTGYDGDASVYVSVDYETLINDNYEKLEYKELPDYAESEELEDLQYIIDTVKYNEYSLEVPFVEMPFFDCEPQSNLSNGDVVTYRPNANVDILNNLFTCEFKAKEGTYKVEGLSDVTEVDIFGSIDNSCVKYEGPDGFAYASIDMTDMLGKTIFENGNISGTIYKDDYDNRFKLRLIEDGFAVHDYNFSLSETVNLYNGQTIYLGLEDIDELSFYGIDSISKQLAIKVNGLPDLITSGKDITKEMISYFLADQMLNQHKGYEESVTGSNNIELAIYFMMPDDVGADEPVIVTVDFYRKCSYKNEYGEREHDDGKYFATIYNPCIKDGHLSCSRYEENLADDYYAPIEEEYALVGENVNVNNYGDFLILLASDKTQKLIDAGYESIESVNATLYCFINESTYVIYEQ